MKVSWNKFERFFKMLKFHCRSEFPILTFVMRISMKFIFAELTWQRFCLIFQDIKFSMSSVEFSKIQVEKVGDTVFAYLFSRSKWLPLLMNDSIVHQYHHAISVAVNITWYLVCQHFCYQTKSGGVRLIDLFYIKQIFQVP